MIHSILLVQSVCLAVFFHNLSPGPLWSGTLYFMLNIFLYRAFAARAHTIATCFALVPKLCHLFFLNLSLSSALGNLSFTSTPHIHLTILSSAQFYTFRNVKLQYLI